MILPTGLLDFEITALFQGDWIVGGVRKVLEEDFASCREVSMSECLSRPLWFRAAVRVARLMAPIQ